MYSRFSVHMPSPRAGRHEISREKNINNMPLFMCVVYTKCGTRDDSNCAACVHFQFLSFYFALRCRTSSAVARVLELALLCSSSPIERADAIPAAAGSVYSV